MTEKEKVAFLELTRKAYVDQAKWFLNGFWNAGMESECENVWKYTQKFIELNKNGCELDEFQAHKFLESLGETLTVIQLREKLRKIDLDANGKMALLEYLSFKYSKEVKQVVNASQGDQTEILKAQKKLEEVQRAFTILQEQLEQQKAALESQKAAEDSVKRSEAELQSAVESLRAEETAYNNKVNELTQKSQDASASLVARNKAANELAQVKGEDPLPLRKAKITQEAALRKVEKERKAAEIATAALESRTRQVEAAVVEAEGKLREAEDYLQEVKSRGGSSQGAIWWMERELKEAQKYLPKKKQTL